MCHKINPELLRRFLQDECSEDEYRQVKNWVNASENEEEVLSFIEKHWRPESGQQGQETINYDKIFGRVKTDIAVKRTTTKHFPTRQAIVSQWLKIAAVLLLPALMVGTYYLIRHQPEEQAIAYEQKTNQRGQKSKISLPDGTVVWLNAASSLRYVSDFLDGKREVVLEGEAFFDVAENERLPFKVITGEVETVALGTSFNINAFPENRTLGIALVTGKVAVSHQHRAHVAGEIILDPGEKVLFDPVTDDFNKLNFDYRKEVSWKQGIIYFENADIEYIRATLERWFNVDLVFSNQPKRPWHFSGEFDNSSLERVLERMAYTERFSFEISDNTVTIEFE